MIETVHQIVEELKALPEYFGKGMVELFVLIVGGVVVGWISSTYFAKKAAEAEVKGDIMKKRLDIYENLILKLDEMLQQVVLPSGIIDMVVSHISKNHISLKRNPQDPLLEIFQTGETLQKTILSIDKYISANRIFLDDKLYGELQFFQNYIAIFNRLIVMYKEQFVNLGISLEDENVKRMEDQTAIEIGLVFQEELADVIQIVCKDIREYVMNINFDISPAPECVDRRFELDGPVMRRMQRMEIMKERKKLHSLVTENVVSALVLLKRK